MWRQGRSLLRRLYSSERRASNGFAGIPGLTQPSDWHGLANDAVSKCEGLVGDVVRAPPTAAVVQLLDDISDTLCQVLDAAEFCRNVHADKEWRQQAQQVWLELSGYVQKLNTHFGLYSALVAALREQQRAAAAGSVSGWDAEALLVGRMLRRDFERYGVHLSGGERDRMTALVHAANQLGTRFTQNVLDPSQLGQLELPAGAAAAEVAALPPHLARRFRPLAARDGRGGVAGLACPADSQLLHSLVRGSRGEGLRRAAFQALHRQPAANLAVLDSLVEARHEVASLMGFDSYSAYQLDSFSLASRPAAVAAFLRCFAAAIAPRCAAEAAELARLKRFHTGGGNEGTSSDSTGSSAARPWDRAFLAAAAAEGGGADALGALPSYLELESVVEGLSQLLRRSMGVALTELPLAQGEGWAPGIRKLAAVHDTDGFLGIVYLDLYRRPQKFPSAAHFTLRCGRRLASGEYQTPVVALVANMAQHAGLALSEVEVLFHEFGHALNSLLSRTRFQHLAGTRGPLDMVELHSNTLELFACEPRVLALFARHRTSGEPLPPGLLRAAQRARRRFAGLELQCQLQYCLIDQLLHGPQPPTGAAADRAIAALMEEHSALGWHPGCHPHIRFTHLVGYGATYYAYLFAQSLAAALWEGGLQGDPMGRAAGDLLRRRLMEPGGAKQAHDLAADLLAAAGSGSGGGGGAQGASGGSGLVAAEGGWYPDPSSMLRLQGVSALDGGAACRG